MTVYDLSIPVSFGMQPDGKVNAFDLPYATQTPFQAGDFIADTEQGGAVNCCIVTIAPHGNGTHTESVSHIVHEMVPVCDIVPLVPVTCTLVSVDVVTLSSSGEDYPEGEGDDLVIPSFEVPEGVEALVIRTRPNEENKRFKKYQNPPYLTADAMSKIAVSGVTHLLLDVPSVDRESDNGVLRNHRTFWDIPLGWQSLETTQARRDRTITEMVFVPDEAPDGSYAISISVPRIETDAMLSRVVLISES